MSPLQAVRAQDQSMPVLRQQAKKSVPVQEKEISHHELNSQSDTASPTERRKVVELNDGRIPIFSKGMKLLLLNIRGLANKMDSLKDALHM